MERALLLALLAVAWPLWLPFLRLVLAEIRLAAKSGDGAPAAGAPAALEPARRSRRVANAAWDSAHFRAARGSRATRSAFRAGRGRTRG